VTEAALQQKMLDLENEKVGRDEGSEPAERKQEGQAR